MIDIQTIVIASITSALADVWHIIGLALILRVILFNISTSRRTITKLSRIREYEGSSSLHGDR